MVADNFSSFVCHEESNSFFVKYQIFLNVNFVSCIVVSNFSFTYPMKTL